MEKSFCFSFTRYNYTHRHTHSSHTHTHLDTNMMPHSVQVSFSGDRREAEGEAAYWGILRELGERGQACQLDFFMGEFSDLCALFLLFSHFFSVFFLFCVCVLIFFAFRLQSNPQQFCRCFVFPIQLKPDSRKNFIMKLNRCQFIRLATRRVLGRSAVPCPLPWYLSRVRQGLPTPVVHFLRPLFC